MKSPKEKFHSLIHETISEYFVSLDGATPNNIYTLVIDHIERPLLESIMQHAHGNQSLAAKWLGISRNTLRKLLSKYQLD